MGLADKILEWLGLLEERHKDKESDVYAKDGFVSMRVGIPKFWEAKARVNIKVEREEK